MVKPSCSFSLRGGDIKIDIYGATVSQSLANQIMYTFGQDGENLLPVPTENAGECGNEHCSDCPPAEVAPAANPHGQWLSVTPDAVRQEQLKHARRSLGDIWATLEAHGLVEDDDHESPVLAVDRLVSRMGNGDTDRMEQAWRLGLEAHELTLNHLRRLLEASLQWVD